MVNKDHKDNKQTHIKDNKVEELENKIQELSKKCTDLETGWKRALADYKNFENRINEEKQNIRTYANQNIISDLLPVLDNLETLQTNIEDEGLNMIIKVFKAVLEKRGLTEINCDNSVFDPSIMEAIDLVDGEKNKVIETLSKGYLIDNNLIRPARVRVGKGN